MAEHSGETGFTILQIIPQSTPETTSITLSPTLHNITATGSDILCDGNLFQMGRLKISRKLTLEQLR